MASRTRLNETPRGTSRHANNSTRSRSTSRKLFEDDESQDSSEGNNSSSWIMRDEHSKLQVSTLSLLQHPNIAKREFTNFVTILGPARQGKSFLMNCLIGEDAFGTSDTMGTCTSGVDVANVVHRVGNKGCALFVDTEGQGDKDVDSDATLLTPVLLLSKVVLFNWKGGLQKNQILNELAVLVEVGNCVSSHSFDKGEAKFGHLHIVLRDFHCQGTAEDALKTIFDPEEKRGEKARELNKIREKLLSSFQSIDVSILPAPCDTSNEKIRDLEFLKTSEEFRESVDELKEKILDQSKEAVRDGIEEMLTQQKDALLEVFEESTAKVDVEATYRDGVLEKLEEFSDREVEARENLLVIRSREAEQKSLLSKAVQEFRAEVEGELRSWASSRLNETIEAKQKEEAYVQKSEQQARLARAVQVFRSGVEDHLQRFRNAFQAELESLVQAFRRNTDGLHQIQELERLRSWVSKRLDEKSRALIETEKLERRQREPQQKLLQQLQQSIQQAYEPFSPPNYPSLSSFSGPSTPYSFSPSPVQSTRQSGTILRYERGELTPDGRLAPPRGCLYKFFKEGELTTDGGLAPPGGCYYKFYEGGQFTPGRVKAPKGGCWKRVFM